MGRAFLPMVLPLDNFRIQDGVLKFDDLEVRYGFRASRALTADWSKFDNHSKATTPILNSTGWQVPPNVSAATQTVILRLGSKGKKR
jgi:hypothetical protein